MHTWTPLAEFAAAAPSPRAAPPGWAHPGPRAVPLPGPARRALEEILDTVVAVQRAEWLEEGVIVGPRAFPAAWGALAGCAARLGVPTPPAVVTDALPSRQAVLGTDERPILHLSAAWLRGAGEVEGAFLLGRLLGPIALGAVTSACCYELLVDHDGLRRVARRHVGPTLEIALAPLSLAARAALARWHRGLTISADRAGLLAAGDLDAATRALLRLALGVGGEVDPDAYAAQAEADATSPGRWTELLASRPWTHKRLVALRWFARSVPWFEARGEAAPADALPAAELAARVDRLLGVRPWSG